MKVAILGAGPAGLYAAYLLKTRLGADTEVSVFEQNPPDATFGFGVVFSDRALEFLEKDDKATHDFIEPYMERWNSITINVKDRTIPIEGVGFTAIGRLQLLLLLQQRAREVGVEPVYNHTVMSMGELDGYDLVIAADGVNSFVRNEYAEEFGTEIEFHPNKFMWYGTTKPYDSLTQTFRANDDGNFTVHHYRFAKDMSTFLVETDKETFERGNFEAMNSEETQTYFEELFAPELDGHPIIQNHSYWRNFPKMTQQRWSYKNMVLVGDALHTAHFSIGSGTRLAMEDVIELVRCLQERPDAITTALHNYEFRRRPIVDKLVTAANTSLDWYTTFGERMKADPMDFVYSYLTRSGRMSDDKLKKIAPSFMKEYLDYKQASSQRD